MDIGSDSLLGLAMFVGAYIVSRIVRERALKRLSTEQKAQLLDAFSGYRTYFMSAAVCLPFLYFVAIKSGLQYLGIAFLFAALPIRSLG
jgi:hypothetical protein